VDDGSHIIMLAAGSGSRMGGPKALMRVNGMPWWCWQHDRLSMLKAPATWVVSQPVHDELERAGAPLKMVINPKADAPMLSSVLVGIRALAADPPGGVFILPVDVPAPDAQVWDCLDARQMPAIPWCQGKSGHPVYLPWRWVQAMLLPLESHGDARLDSLLESDSIVVETDDADVLVNLNSPSDVQAWTDR